MKRYLTLLTTILTVLIFTGCWSSGPKIENVSDNSTEESNGQVEIPPESDLIDKIEEQVVIEDTPSDSVNLNSEKRPKIESVD